MKRNAKRFSHLQDIRRLTCILFSLMRLLALLQVILIYRYETELFCYK